MDLRIWKYNFSLIKNDNTKIVSGDSKALIVGGGRMFGNLNLLSNYKFADVILVQLFQKVIDAMSGIVWTFEGSENQILQLMLKRIFEKRFGEIYNSLYFKGYAVFAVNFDLNFVKLLCNNEFKIDSEGAVYLDSDLIGYKPYIIYSDTYKMLGKTDFMVCKDMFCHIDNLMNAINATTENLGAMGILSPEALTGVMTKFSDTEKARIQKEYQEQYGLKVGKWSIMITPVPTKFQQINLPIKDLELQAKFENAVKVLAGYHKVPYELIALSGQSTYANRSEARKELIDITCKFYANKLFDLSREIFFAKNVTSNYSFEQITVA